MASQVGWMGSVEELSGQANGAGPAWGGQMVNPPLTGQGLVSGPGWVLWWHGAR